MILIDTNVVSELMRVSPDPNVTAWMRSQAPGELFVSAVTTGELLRGILRLPAGKRRKGLLAWWERAITQDLAGGVLAFDDRCARVWAQLLADQDSRGSPLPALDAMIAATAKVHGLTVATRNLRDFERSGVKVVNPWKS